MIAPTAVIGASLLPLVLGGPRPPAATPPEPDVYEVRFAPDRSAVEVEARITLRDSKLQMRRSVWSAHLPDRWATFVRDLRASAGGSSQRPLPYLGDARWDAGDLVGERIRLSYRVLLRHDRRRWPYGARESVRRTQRAVHLVSMAVLVHAPSVGPFRVILEVPPGWDAVASWDPDGTGYRGRGAHELVHSLVVAGEIRPRPIVSGGRRWTLVTDGVEPGERERATALLSDVVDAATDLFGGAPSGRRLVVMVRGPDGGGAAFHRAFVLEAPGFAEDETGWKRSLAHEAIHAWLGGDGIRTTTAAMEWFKEGFTAYATAVVLARSGAIDAEGRRREVARLRRMYEGQAGKRPLTEAGFDERRWYDLVYGGGAMVARALDEGSCVAGSGGLDALLARLWASHGPGKPALELAGLLRVVEAEAGPDAAASVAESVRTGIVDEVEAGPSCRLPSKGR